MHFKGCGVPKDNINAYAWCSLAAANGHPAGKHYLTLIESKMKPTQIQQAQLKAAGLHLTNKKS